MLLLPVTHIRKIIVFRALQLGDMLCSVPAFRALRLAYPDAHITLAGLPWAADFVRRFGAYLDDFVHFPGYPGLPEQEVNVGSAVQFIETIQEGRFDLALQLQGNGNIVNPMIALWGARYTAGFRCRGDYCPDERLFIEYPEGIHEIQRHLQLMAHLGISANGEGLEFPIGEEERAAFHQLSLPLVRGRYICVHPGSRGNYRQWPPAFFATTADYMAREGWTIVLTGTAEERPLTEKVAGLMQYPALNVAGRTTLGSLAVLIAEARALLSNCTGVSHMAAALRTPSLIISMDGEPERWGPLDQTRHTTIDWLQHPELDTVLMAAEHLIG
ncbi:glycosyltransferase family 9 protein [Chitinophaga pendula]|uniref:glycosyltransferase family 9 protein n=1 Tax=Chitinophaga TaxID=79328 RepID=UPI000BB00E25|nr:MULTISPECIES: glycosyltransferase family 9 protein [Chitinophaga]ASZ15092.1 LPS biosynthesis glycosyltransferase [Chitinophaga sp. MD30]UCJ08555.1 glycosyltransferase family 9 protein [Chitinophaga pendula]